MKAQEIWDEGKTMTEEEQINQMARDLVTNCMWMDSYDDYDDYNDGYMIDTVATCKKMYEQGYQKVGKDKVILSKKAYEQLLREKDQLIDDRFIVCHALRQEAARNAAAGMEAVIEFAKTLISLFWEEEEGETVKRKDVQGVIRDVLRMHYQVEVE